jgi:methylated-DNA-[protein]-cysteine S-methyltransferase
MAQPIEYSDSLQSPAGLVIIKANSAGITEVEFIDRLPADLSPNKITASCKQQLHQYFDGQREQFDLPLDAKGTEFQQSVWRALGEIAFGQSVSYSDIANRLNNPKAVRAVGAANGKNPIAIIVPCHRVIGADRSLTGYAGGLERKAWLLSHEGIEFNNGQHDRKNDKQTELF